MPMRSKGYAKVHLQRKHAWRRALIVFCTKTFALARWVWSVIIGRRMQQVPWQTVLWHCTALTITFVFVAPFFWVLTSSLRPLGLPPPRALEWAPQELAWTNYAEIFRIAPLGRQIGNSILVSTVGAVLTLVTASAAGFAKAQVPERPRRWLVMLTIGLLMTPSTAVWLPRYVLFSKLGLIDTYAVLVAPALMGTNAAFVLLLYWSFRQAPAEGLAKVLFRGTQGQFAVRTGHVRGTVGCAASRGLEQVGLAVGQAGDQHAVVQQWQHHRQQRRLLTAMDAAG